MLQNHVTKWMDHAVDSPPKKSTEGSQPDASSSSISICEPFLVSFFQMYVPNGVGAFGSTYKEIEELDEGWNFYLTKTRWKYLDRPTHRCGEEIRYKWEFLDAVEKRSRSLSMLLATYVLSDQIMWQTWYLGTVRGVLGSVT